MNTKQNAATQAGLNTGSANSSPSATPSVTAKPAHLPCSPNARKLLEKIKSKEATVGVVGVGYVGLPLLCSFAKSKFGAIGFDIDANKIEKLHQGVSYFQHIPSSMIAELASWSRFNATTDFSLLAQADCIILCVPTPLTRQREPDMSFIEKTTEMVAKSLRPGQLVVLESTTYPGTTEDVVVPILEKSGLKRDEDFYVAFSPEREDPGNRDFSITTVPKVVGADTPDARALAESLYASIVGKVVPVSSARTAEAVKLVENVFRSVNIALVNELKVIFEEMDIDVWEVINAAKTKPFGFMPFYPGPGLGGHCIPIDPFYLTWKAREYGKATRFIELAGEINTSMPVHVISRLSEALDRRSGVALSRSRILMLGLAYKKNVDDMRESPSLTLWQMLEKRGAEVSYYDPYLPTVPFIREHPEYAGKKSIEWNDATLASFDAALIVTDHDNVDYADLVAKSKLVLDTRNALHAIEDRSKIVKA